MNGREVASLALKLLGVYAIIVAISLIQALQYVRYLLVMVDRAGRPDNTPVAPGAVLLGLLPLVLLVIAAYVLLTRSESLARRMVKEGETVSLGRMSSRDVQAIAFSVAGAIVFILAIPALFEFLQRLAHIGQIYLNMKSSPERNNQLVNLAISGLGVVLQCVLGLVLFFRSRRVAEFWHRLQTDSYVRFDGGQRPEPTDREE